ncbi:hypothetical protein Tco_0923255 [Tanacetum coccineum]|uniref:Uncharacterized protein n=1 Tax=Tanacetum coccineum TaxID=301880 RepID=A0ABQ5D3S1_9ASTR
MLGLKRLHGFLEVTAAQVHNGNYAKEKNKEKMRSKLGVCYFLALQMNIATFSQYPMLKSMFAAIETRFGGNASTKKTQKTLLKQYAARPSVYTGQVHSLHCQVVSSSDNTVYAFMVENLNGYNVLHQDLEQIHKDDLEAMDMSESSHLLCVRAKKSTHQMTGKRFSLMSIKKQGRSVQKSRQHQEARKQRRHFQGNVALMCNLSYSGLDEFKEPEFKGYGPENSKKESNVGYEKESDNSKENSDKSLVKEHESQYLLVDPNLSMERFAVGPLFVDSSSMSSRLKFLKAKL